MPRPSEARKLGPSGQEGRGSRPGRARDRRNAMPRPSEARKLGPSGQEGRGSGPGEARDRRNAMMSRGSSGMLAVSVSNERGLVSIHSAPGAGSASAAQREVRDRRPVSAARHGEDFGNRAVAIGFRPRPNKDQDLLRRGSPLGRG